MFPNLCGMIKVHDQLRWHPSRLQPKDARTRQPKQLSLACWAAATRSSHKRLAVQFSVATVYICTLTAQCFEIKYAYNCQQCMFTVLLMNKGPTLCYRAASPAKITPCLHSPAVCVTSMATSHLCCPCLRNVSNMC